MTLHKSSIHLRWAILGCFFAALVSASSASTLPVSATYETTTTTTEGPPRPYKFAYSAGRAPGGKPDRYAQQQGDEYGNIRGSYAYLDPNWKWRQVEYVATEEGGFQVVGGTVDEAKPPVDTVAVQQAKANHAYLYDQIAVRNAHPPAQPPVPAYAVGRLPSQSRAVEKARAEHQDRFRQIQAQHQEIAALHAKLSQEQKEIDEAEEY